MSEFVALVVVSVTLIICVSAFALTMFMDWRSKR